MLLVTILASASCLAVYLVNRKRVMLLAFVGFLFYFFDIALVFQNDFVAGAGISTDALYQTITMLATVITGAGFLGAFWFLVCDYLGNVSKRLGYGPVIVFVAASVAMLMFPDSDLRTFAFYTVRDLFLFWILGYGGYRYAKTTDAMDKSRMARHRKFYAALWVLGICVLLEDVCFFLFLDPMQISFGPRSVSINRNFSENVLMLCCIFFACRAAYRSLQLRYEKPNAVSLASSQEDRIEDSLALYGNHHGLSEREMEVLTQVVAGKDNQNIASEMNLALSTVKVHVHNILQKTGQGNRQELLQDFWRES